MNSEEAMYKLVVFEKSFHLVNYCVLECVTLTKVTK